MTAAPARLIAALQLPAFRPAAGRPQSWYEDYLMANVRVFVDGGIAAIKLQDETRESGPADPETLARMGALARLVRREFPKIALGIITQAHDPFASLAIAAAAEAHFVRLKIFVGAAVNAEGVREALAPRAVDYRAKIAAPQIEIFADVHDRTARPLAAVPDEMAALWAEGMGADRLVVTGSDFNDTLLRIKRARAAGVSRPIIIGGGVNDGNVADALRAADGVIVSTSVRRKTVPPGDLVMWDGDAVARLVEAALRVGKSDLDQAPTDAPGVAS
jgi:predicted TIM-barrel enzyme